jgi:adenylate cyclase
MATTRVSFRITVLTLFTVLTIGLSAVILSVNYMRNKEAVLLAADRLLEQAAARILAATDQLIAPLFSVTNTAALLPGIDVGSAERGLTPSLFEVLQRNPQMIAAYLGNDRGEFYRVASLASLRERARAFMKAPPQAAFAVQTITLEGRRRIERWRYYDAGKRAVGVVVDHGATYDPRNRPWYSAARSSKQAIVTDFYPFASAPQIGLTVARSVNDAKGTVFATDLTLTAISRYLATVRGAQLSGTQNAELAVFNLDGGLLAHSDNAAYERVLNASDTPRIPGVSEVGSGIMPRIVAATRGGVELQRRVTGADGALWLVHVAPLGAAYGEGAHLAVAVPVDDFLDPFVRRARETLYVLLGIIVAFLPVVYLAAGAITAPLRRLAGEIAGLQNFDVKSTPPERSSIAEIQDLTGALATAKFMLGAFAKYVPKNLVRQIVHTGDEPRLGGERRPVTVFFSDVRDFTTISEQVLPERLMEFTSEYLEGLVKIVLEERGTVDKFVGDQVMAYWNAPTPNPDHAADGCRAVLRCRDWSNAQNERWAREGTPILYTRFALHLGDAIVGNVGSSDRMDYTVMGASINLGSRIEGLNKVYGTQVLVTRPVADAVGDRFVTRPVDRVLPKGAVNPLDIFELLGAPAGLDARTIERAKAWGAFYGRYLSRNWPSAEIALDAFTATWGADSLTRIYAERIHRFKAEPPLADWDGVIRYTTK